MMNVKLIETYARTLYNRSVAEKSSDKLVSDLAIILDILDNSKNLARFLEAPIYGVQEKLEILSEFMKKLKFEKLSQNFLETLVENKRTEYIRNIYKKLLELKLNSEGITNASLISVRPMKEKELQKCTEMLEEKLKKKFLISNIIDPAIIGGVVLKYGSSMYDLSIANMTKKISRLNQ